MKEVGFRKWVEDESGEYLCTDPKMAASAVKKFLEGGKKYNDEVDRAPPEEGVCVFNPNSDNAFLFGGDPATANAAWVRPAGTRTAVCRGCAAGRAHLPHPCAVAARVLARSRARERQEDWRLVHPGGP